MDMEAISPSRESVPYSLKMSRRRPVAAEEEEHFYKVSGTSSPGKPMYAVKWPMIDDRKSRKPGGAQDSDCNHEADEGGHDFYER